MGTFFKFTAWIQKTFALWVVLFAGIALLSPEPFVWMKAYITWMLGLIMFGMGMTMTLDDFKGVMQNPKAVAIGVVAQFVVMPSLIQSFERPVDRDGCLQKKRDFQDANLE